MTRLAVFTTRARFVGADTSAVGRLILGDPPPNAPPCANVPCATPAHVEVELEGCLGTHALCVECLNGLVSFAVGQLDPFG